MVVDLMGEQHVSGEEGMEVVAEDHTEVGPHFMEVVVEEQQSSLLHL